MGLECVCLCGCGFVCGWFVRVCVSLCEVCFFSVCLCVGLIL